MLAALLLIRLPSLVQPAGADQGLYAYVGTRILQGELPYRDAWDQKPPAIHFAYAVMYALWPHDSIIALIDLAAALVVALMLVRLGTALSGSDVGGGTAAGLFLLLGDPTLGRLGGVRIRAQCETFIAVAVTAAILLIVAPRRHARPALAGLLIGAAVTFKYNAAVYLPVALAAAVCAAADLPTLRRWFALAAAGFVLPIGAMIVVFAAGGALGDLYHATVTYNLQYSGETYAGVASYFLYLLTFPVSHARIDALWTLGGVGCLVLLVAAVSSRSWFLVLPILWVGAACLSIAINGSRGLPQYFVQAAPALALAAGVGTAHLWRASSRLRSPPRILLRASVAILAGTAAWRVDDFGKIPRNASHDLAFMFGAISEEQHLARYGGRMEDKYAALAVARLGSYLRSRTAPTDRVYIFGFSPGAYVEAERASASRFFWSRPVIVGFMAGSPSYGASGVLEELRSRSPAYIVLQAHDWAPPPDDSATFFLSHPLLGAWLSAHYERAADFADEDYDVWRRRPL